MITIIARTRLLPASGAGAGAAILTDTEPPRALDADTPPQHEEAEEGQRPEVALAAAGEPSEPWASSREAEKAGLRSTRDQLCAKRQRASQQEKGLQPKELQTLLCGHRQTMRYASRRGQTRSGVDGTFP